MGEPIDPNSGFCPATKIYHSLRPSAPLPSETAPLSVTHYAFSLLLHHRQTTTSALIDAATRHRIPYSDIPRHVNSLASSLREIGLSKNDAALVLVPNSVHVPILYLALYSLGVVVSPSNPASSPSDISRQIYLSKPAVAFATSDTAHKLPCLRYKTILLDSPEFETMLNSTRYEGLELPEVFQSDTAAILYSSGTTGKIKGVVLTHGNIIATMAGARAGIQARTSPAVALCTVPYFHVYGFIYCVRSVAFGDSVVSMRRFDLQLMLRAVEEFKVTHLALAPPVAVAIANGGGGVVERFDLGSLEAVLSGGAPLTNAVVERFKGRFPDLPILQAYGLTETTGAVTRTIGPSESKVLGATGRLISNCQAKIVDPHSGIGLPPNKQGELWVRGPYVMKGYVSDEKAFTPVLDSEGWLRTGDLCYFNSEGFLFFVDRLKELIKYKAYQVPPAELEQLLQSHPDVVDAAVIPYPDEEAGQVPMAFVVAPYKKIRRVSFIDSIPKNAPGKVLRKELIKLSLSGANSKL
ncbi:hypothetical protein RJ639_029146 [Escallonia herrerae]|uniref:4-coumarate--CoA ligase n=1 Tax=Escallonia herrerae TaxID=1293975 RepID=A0AA89BL92_9ASTE|nr:hypothetical protein RJ639_029146 [Escallonia herrerae]